MRKIFHICLIIIAIFVLVGWQKKAVAQNQTEKTQCIITTNPNTITSDNVSSGVTFTITNKNGSPTIEEAISQGIPQKSGDGNFPGSLYWYSPVDSTSCYDKLVNIPSRGSPISGPLQGSVGGHWYSNFSDCVQGGMLEPGAHEIGLWYYSDNGDPFFICKGVYQIRSRQPKCNVNYTFSNGGNVNDKSLSITISDFSELGTFDTAIHLTIDGESIPINYIIQTGKTITIPIPDAMRSADNNKDKTDHTAIAYVGFESFADLGSECGRKQFPIYAIGKTNICADPSANITNPVTGAPTGSKRCDKVDENHDYSVCPWCTQTSSHVKIDLVNLCDQLPKTNSYADSCWKCAKKSETEKTPYVWTAIGCVPTDFTSFVNDYVLKYGIGIAGGIAFLRFLYGCFLILTSAGNPETIEEAKGVITSSLMGLFFIILSVFLLRTIGVDILQIPGFGPVQKCIYDVASGTQICK